MLSIQVDYNAGIDKIHDFMPEKLKILKFPDPRLRTVAEKVTKFDKSLEKLSDDMLHTMYEGNGIGLAATQVNKHIRLIVMDLSEERNEPRVFINPEYEILDNESLSSFEEGCLSVPGFSEEIIRPDIIVKGGDYTVETVVEHDLAEVYLVPTVEGYSIDYPYKPVSL